ncbi:coproporphyrinogen-III oxidase family protein [Kitasatospora sp. NPDC101235]|uniref:coproporphyrinogen-III oxidase family protein n=1 Tax=Kitasatospora sp. NPDC101235 TaxID=3364101 RepID=UPI0037F532CA
MTPMGPAQLLSAAAHAVKDDTHRPLAIYLHVPFCRSKCHFCDWVVDIPVRRLRFEEEERRAYLDALSRQIRLYGPLLTGLGYRPDVMYWGGGTPTRLTPRELTRLAEAVQESFDLSTLRQWSVETTPNDLTEDVVAMLREAGVDRMSVGVQSLSDYQLRVSGRVHGPDDVMRAVELLRAGGIDNFNVDLISGFPGETLASLGETFDRLLPLAPPHVSVYPYRATPKTVMAMQLTRRQSEAHNRTAMTRAYEFAMDRLRSAGYHEYCHGYWVRDAAHEDQDGNYKYDLTGDKIGFGSGAESIIGHHLLWNENRKYEDYLENPDRFTFAHRFSLDDPSRLTAPVGGALMTREGVVFERFRRLTGLSFHDVRDTPYFSRWLTVLTDCGARLVETPTALRMETDTIHRAYITHLAYTMYSGLTPERA